MSKPFVVKRGLDNPSLSVDALQRRALALWEKDKGSAQQLGAALLAVQAAMPKGAFADWWRKHGLEENRVYYCIREAQGKDKRLNAAPSKREEEPSPKEKELLVLLEEAFGNGQAAIQPTHIRRFGKHAVCPQVRYGRYKVTLLLAEADIKTLHGICKEAYASKKEKAS